MEKIKGSMMTEGLYKNLSSQDLANLLEYLSSLKRNSSFCPLCLLRVLCDPRKISETMRITKNTKEPQRTRRAYDFNIISFISLSVRDV